MVNGNNLVIQNVKIFQDNGSFVDGKIQIENGMFTKIGTQNDDDVNRNIEHIDGTGYYAIPGLIDIHLHGALGKDFCDGEADGFDVIRRYEASVGVTTVVGATMTLGVEELEDILRVGANCKWLADGADFAGFNMEGPFISEAKKGAQNADYIKDVNVDIFRRFQKAADGKVVYFGIAPEKEGAHSFISEVKEETNLALAHTNANYDDASQAFRCGANHVVHLYNAMPPYNHREPGVVGATLEHEAATAELICDGIHIHPGMVRNTVKILGTDRLIFISDSMRATGLEDGIYDLGGQPVEVKTKEKKAVLAGTDVLAGSISNLYDCLRTAVKEMGIPLGIAVKCATVNPAKSAHLFGNYGSITEGKKGNVLLIDKDMNLISVIKDGKRLEVKA